VALLSSQTCIGNSMKLLSNCNHAATGFASHLLALLRWLALALVLAGTVSPALAAKTYSDNGDGTVTDPTTGLIWMRCAMGQTWDGVNSTCTGTASTYTFDQANALTGTVTIAGQSDWRVPTIRELQSIVERAILNPAIDRTAFPAAPASSFWSASAHASLSGFAWYAYFSWGAASYGGRDAKFAVRLVRAGQSSALLDSARPIADYVDQGAGIVMHTPTRLIWQRCAVGQSWTGTTCSGTPSTFTWDAAKVLKSSFAGQTDWRVPTEEELLSLVDYSGWSPAINTTWFPNTDATIFWSASALALSTYDGAWDIDFRDGVVFTGYSKSSSRQVRLVRAGPCFGPLALGVSRTGTGRIYNSAYTGFSCDTVAGATGYFAGDVVTLTASPSANLISWGGACASAGTVATCTVTMDAAKSVTATFKDTPLITGLPSTLTFAPQNIASTSTAQTVTLSNTGAAALNITSITATGDFAVTNNCGANMGAGGFCTLNITFKPTVSGTRTGTLTVTSDAPDSPHIINLSGSGTSPLALTVANLNDSGGGSLRDAVAQTNSNPGPDTIDFASGLQGTLTLTSGQISINDALTVTGPGANLLTIDGNAKGRLFFIDKSAALALGNVISPDFLVSLSGMTLTHGLDTNEPSKDGGAIKSYKSLTLSHMVLSGNQANNGGAIAFYPENDAALSILNSTLSNNTAVNAAASGAGYGGALTVGWRYTGLPTQSTVSVVDSRIENNASDCAGAGVKVNTLGLTQVLRSAIVGNQVAALSTNSCYRNGAGVNLGWGDFVMEASEVSGNAAAGVGGGLNIYQENPNYQTPETALHATIRNSTITGNAAGSTGGGINVHGNVSLALNASTVVNNTAPSGATAGVRISTGATNPATVPASNVVDARITMASTIVWNNLAGTKMVDVARAASYTTPSTPITANDSLAGYVSAKVSVAGTGNLLGIDPMLGALADNGGSTRTHLPLSGSPVLGRGACLANVTTDQRGAARPVAGCDMGAVELASAAQAPGAPTQVVATAGNGSASISFVAPILDGGAPVTSYTVLPSGGVKSTTSLGLPVLVKGLTNGTPYTFTVTAANEAGQSVASALSNSITPMASTLALSASSLDFGSQALGSPSSAKTLTLSNTGASTVALAGIAVSGDFTSSNTCGSSLASGAVCSILVTFTPTISGSLAGSLTLSSDAEVSSLVVVLSGSGAGSSNALVLAPGWNLLGNGQDQPLAVAGLFGNTANVTTVWKWDVAKTGWQFYAPGMDAATLQSYATGKGYGILSSINPGEGFWVNALQAFSVNQPSGAALTGADFAAGQAHALKPNWNLVALGTALTPSDFNRGLSATPPATGAVPINLTTLWAWDNPGSKWYFYSPSLEGQGGYVLFDYTAGKSYLDFTATGKTLGAGMGFWVNKP